MLNFLLFSMFFACNTQKDKNPQDPAKPLTSTEQKATVQTGGLPQDKIDFYTKEFPAAARFTPQSIAEEYLSELDKSNNTYYEIHDKTGTLIGYVRDFAGPVTSDADCACNPLSLTLAFNSDFTLRNILSVAPLQKYGHEPLTEAEHKQMVEIAKNPSAELLSLKAPQDMVDGATGATAATYKGKVVDKAGYSSWRIARLAMETSQIIQGMIIQKDADRLQTLLKEAKTPEEMSAKIIEFLPTANSNYLKQRAIFILAELYMQTLSSGKASDPKIEDTILNANFGANQEAELLINLCLAFVEQKSAPDFVRKCIVKLEANPLRANFDAQLSLLKGLELIALNKGKEAIPLLEKGLAAGGASPELLEKMAVIYKQLGEAEKSCTQLKNLYVMAPKWNNIESMLLSCGKSSLIAELNETRKQDLLKTRIPKEKEVSVSAMKLKDEQNAIQDIQFGKNNKISVIVFFATWCPHCQKEMPRLVEFYTKLQQSEYKDKVELLAVRASIQRETQSLVEFRKEYKINFPILTDEGIAFESFASEQQKSPGFPMMAISNSQGKVSYFLAHGDYNDTAQELFWIIDDLK